jgi:large subunit ribosomal protein L18
MQITKNYRHNQSHVVKRRVVRLTDYGKRFKLLKSGLPRLVLRKTNKYVIAQLVEYNPIGDHIIWTCSTKALVGAKGLNNGTNEAACVALGAMLPLDESSDFIIDKGMRRPVEGRSFFIGFVCSGIRPNVSKAQTARLWVNSTQ